MVGQTYQKKKKIALAGYLHRWPLATYFFVCFRYQGLIEEAGGKVAHAGMKMFY